MTTETPNTTPASITYERVQALLEASDWHDMKLGRKTTVVVCTLPSGFEIVGSASCVDPAAYDHDLGVSIAMRRVRERVWELEGYALQVRRAEEAGR